MAVLDEQSWAIEVIDILARLDEAETAYILATPTLSDETAQPPRRIVGDLTDIDQIINFFGCRRKENS
jgi:circadian clock protein KaiB